MAGIAARRISSARADTTDTIASAPSAPREVPPAPSAPRPFTGTTSKVESTWVPEARRPRVSSGPSRKIRRIKRGSAIPPLAPQLLAEDVAEGGAGAGLLRAHVLAVVLAL